MGWFILAVLIPVAVVTFVAILLARDCVDWLEISVALAASLLVSVIICLGLAIELAACTTGACPGYGEGTSEGYIVVADTQGSIWKTHEVKIQTGTGKQSAIQELRCFSVPPGEDAVWSKVLECRGHRVRLHYRQWLVMPFRMGSTDKQVLEVELLE